jgi:hypothetical protein
MRPELFRAYADHLSKAADMVTTEEIWGDVSG